MGLHIVVVTFDQNDEFFPQKRLVCVCVHDLKSMCMKQHFYVLESLKICTVRGLLFGIQMYCHANRVTKDA